jgi:hypothetical protein
MRSNKPDTGPFRRIRFYNYGLVKQDQNTRGAILASKLLSLILKENNVTDQAALTALAGSRRFRETTLGEHGEHRVRGAGEFTVNQVAISWAIAYFPPYRYCWGGTNPSYNMECKRYLYMMTPDEIQKFDTDSFESPDDQRSKEMFEWRTLYTCSEEKELHNTPAKTNGGQNASRVHNLQNAIQPVLCRFYPLEWAALPSQIHKSDG